ncbi:putative TetR family transcriptional regulator [Gordonia effusa NBRC 100432]|uniref:Putative TetR family transcriptional regulator n=1 Tax=Gordonia effusa NBRC 100432 TaxID=1077974 RepID=H0QYR6_9ACTN|nr:TetR/AcrR family transcriptional regulator [Gordonia effusa]GAB17967.1 putative TetR family transcriptional regulator [Gordonia effusa NBRC 100432]
MAQASGSYTKPPRGRGRPPVQGLWDRRREEIVTAAVEVMSSVGYEDASMAQIARAAGIGSATIYRYVGSKRELLDDVFESVTRQVVAALLPAESSDDSTDLDIIDQASTVGGRLYDLIESDLALVKLLAVQASAVDKALQERVLRINALINAQISASLGRVTNDGNQARSQAERGLSARLIVGLGLPGAVVTVRGTSTPRHRRGYVRSMKSIALQGMFASDVQVPSVVLARLSGRLADSGIAAAVEAHTRPESRRSELLDAALECFAAQSYRETGASAIAERAGVSHGTFYNYFDNRREVVDELVARETRNLMALVEFQRPRPRTAVEFQIGLAAIVRRLAGYAAKHRAALEFVILGAPGVDDRALNGLLALWEQLLWLCEGYVRSGVADGYLRDDVEVVFLAEALLSVLYTSITATVVRPVASADIDTQVTTTVAFACHGLRSHG